PNLCFNSSGRATVKCDLLASSNVNTTSLSGTGSTARSTPASTSDVTQKASCRIMVILRNSAFKFSLFAGKRGGCGQEKKKRALRRAEVRKTGAACDLP